MIHSGRRSLATWLPILLPVLVQPHGAAAQTSDDAYLRSCAPCHAADLRGGETGPALVGDAFRAKWADLPAEILERFTRGSMPPTNPGGLAPADYASAVARIRAANGFAPPVAPALTSPPPVPTTEWLHHRGDPGSTSYSPLAQISRDNVRDLRIAWRWKSDNFGPTPEFYFRATPLMADGVLYTTAGIRRSVVAIDAANGETLWMYRLDEGERLTGVECIQSLGSDEPDVTGAGPEGGLESPEAGPPNG